MYVATVGFFNVIGQLLLFDFSVDVIGQLANRVRRHHASFWVGGCPNFDPCTGKTCNENGE